MRTEFTGDFHKDSILQELRSDLPPQARVSIPDSTPASMVVFASTEHHCLADLLIRHQFRQLPVNLLAVISNHPALGPLVQKFDIPFHHIPTESRSKEEHESAVLGILDSLKPDYLALAKYMRILSPDFVKKWPNRIINIHHSFLPAFAGARPYHQAYARGVKVIGATAHFVTDALDEGPIIAQQVIPINHSHSIHSLAQAGHDVEQTTLAHALRLVFENRVFLCHSRTVIFD
jgi:formyltetrahydrofolate deformylase